MAQKYFHKFSSLDFIRNLPNAAGCGVVGGALFVNADGTPVQVGGASLGKTFYVDAVNGSASNDGRSPGKAFSTLALAYAACTAGKNDTVIILSDGATTGTARLAESLTWAKAQTHLLGLAAPSLYSQRARVAPTAALTAFTPMITLSASGCLFQNIQFWHGFTTGAAAQIALEVTGSRNVFRNCHLAGMADAESAASATSRILNFTGGGENYFDHCVIGIDTVTRTAANASIEFLSGAARNVFEDCLFPVYATGSGTGALFVKTAAAAAMDRYNIFRRCNFLNPGALSGGVTLAAVATLAAASGGGLIFDYCSRFLVTDWGTDATSLGQIYVNGSGTGGTATDDVGRGAVAVAS
jgi:hypothetical protein